MLFNSLEYALFLLAVFALFWALARLRVARTVLLLVASWVFYMSWNATFVFLIVASTLLDYGVALGLSRTPRKALRRVLLGLSLAGNLGVLALFKYADFGIDAVWQALRAVGVETEPPLLGLVLPVGISFYTFQTLSYTIDVYRGRLEPTRSFLDFATYVAFFPQLVAGPIVRASELLPQLRVRPTLDLDRAGDAVFLVLRGLAKKVLVADFVATRFIDLVWDDPGAWSTADAWLAAFGYSVQLYADFSGYTDIARGSARLFGLELPENFRRPFQATSIADFWNRWHITLSTWIRDYVYISLGGARQGRTRKYANIFVAFIATGIWHGAGWTFVCFALFHAVMTTLTHGLRDATGRSDARASGATRVGLVVITNVLLAAHWPTFRSSGTANMLAMYERMFAFEGGEVRAPVAVLLVLGAMAAWHMTPLAWMEALRARVVRMPALVQAALVCAAAAILTWVGSGQAAPFVYYQF